MSRTYTNLLAMKARFKTMFFVSWHLARDPLDESCCALKPDWKLNACMHDRNPTHEQVVKRSFTPEKGGTKASSDNESRQIACV
jgi:hypothetical protein